jgi:subfamily B ATP-binding cassette protein MsbA
VTSRALPFRLLRRDPGLLAAFAAASLGRAALTAVSILLIREFLGGVLGEREGLAGWATATYGSGPTLWAIVALLLGTSLGAAALSYAAQVNQQRIVKVIELGTMERLITRLLGLSVGYFDRRTHGDLIQAVRNDVANLRAVAIAGATIAIESLQAAGLIAASAILSPWLALWAFVLMPLATWPIIRIARRTLARSFGIRRKGVALFDVLLQLLRGIRIIKMYQGESAESKRTIDRARGYFDELIAMERVRSLARVVLESIGSLSLVVVIIVGGFQVMAGSLGWPELLAFLMAARAAQVPINIINTNYIDIQRFGASVAHIDALLEEEPEIRSRSDARPLVAGPSAIAARELSFEIGGVQVLRDVSFDVRAGETLGVVGPSGAGKTTLLNLVARLYDPSSGAVLLDGEDLRTLRLEDVYGRIAIVTQEPFLFTTSIRENIRCGRPGASDDEIVAAARSAEIHDDILAMPHGYDTVVGHGGRALSLGEVQRVNLARAVLKNAPVLLFDEATSGLDSHAEARVQQAIDRLVPGRITIAVAHRLSTLRNATRILVLEHGRAVGLGTHAELVDHCPMYRRLWRSQTESGPGFEFVSDGGPREAAGG